MFRSAILLCAIGFIASIPLTARLQAQEQKAPTQAELQALVKQLGDDDFDKRQEAISALSKLGMAAKTALEAAAKSEDLETKNAAVRLLDGLKWTAVKPDADYLACAGANDLAVIQIKDLKANFDTARKTAFAQLFETGAFKPFFELLRAESWEKLSPEEKENVHKWLDYTSGDAVGLLNKINPMVETENDMVAVVRLVPQTKDEAFAKFLSDTGIAQESTIREVKGLKIYTPPDGQGALTLLGNHFIIGLNIPSVMKVADALVEPRTDGLTASTDFKALQAKLTPAPIALYANMQGLKKMYADLQAPVFAMMGAAFDANNTGLEYLKLMAWTIAPNGDQFEERFVMQLQDDGELGRLKALKATMKADLPLQEQFNLIPANAVLVSNSYADGNSNLEVIKQELKQLTANPMFAQLAEIEKQLTAFETAVGVKLSQLITELKGHQLFWAKLESGLIPPEIGIAYHFADEAKAKAYLELLTSLINGVGKFEKLPKELGITADTKLLATVERDGFSFVTEPAESPLMKLPQRQMVPYRFSLGAYGKWLIVSSSPKSLLERLAALRDKTPGFDVAKLIAKTTHNSGGPEPLNLFSIDLPQLLQYGTSLGVPLLAPMTANNPPLQKALNAFMENPDPFKQLKPLTALLYPLDKEMLSLHMNSPSPTLLSVFALVGGVGYWKMSSGAAAFRDLEGVEVELDDDDDGAAVIIEEEVLKE